MSAVEAVVYGFCTYLFLLNCCCMLYLHLIYPSISFIFVIKICIKLHLCVSLAPAEKNPLIEKGPEREKRKLKLKRARDTFPEIPEQPKRDIKRVSRCTHTKTRETKAKIKTLLSQ